MKAILLAAALASGPTLAQSHQHGSSQPARDDKLSEHEHPYDKAAPKPAGQDLQLQVGGETAKAYVARPKGKPAGAILVFHEYWGLNDWIRHMADELAKEGYLALALDLYRGKVATDPTEAAALAKNRDEAWGDKVEEASLEWLKSNAQGAKRATLGWCMGGGEALRTSLHDPKDVDVTVVYYGRPVTELEALKKLRGPLLGIWAKRDRGITPDDVDAFDRALKAAGVPHEFHTYDAEHAFANPSGGRYNGEAAKDAWEKTRTFLARNLKGSRP